MTYPSFLEPYSQLYKRHRLSVSLLVCLFLGMFMAFIARILYFPRAFAFAHHAGLFVEITNLLVIS